MRLSVLLYSIYHKMTNFGNRIVVLIDMDCFFCQVEAKLNPRLKGKAMAVVQYSTFGPGAYVLIIYIVQIIVWFLNLILYY